MKRARDAGMTRRVLIGAMIAVAALSIYVLESARAGLTYSNWWVGPTPVTTLAKETSDGPHVVIAHGFAGSREMMQGYGQVLAQAGYRVHLFDFEGHGAHPLPMTGDVTRIEGVTRRLVDQTLSVVDAVADDRPVALLGHSMATDILVRAVEESDRTGPLVLLSAFSLAITAEHPDNMLLISGQWEPPLRDFAVDALRMVDPDAQEGQSVRSDTALRAAIVAPYADHVSILQSRAGREAALDWLNRAYGRTEQVSAPPTGWAFLALLAAVTALARPVAGYFASGMDLPRKPDLKRRHLALVVLVPAIATPLIATPFDIRFLPVLVADYLALHLFLYGVLMLGLLGYVAGPLDRGRVSWPALLGLCAWGIALFGFVLDRYGANFFPGVERVPIIAALAIGAVPFMVADALVNWRLGLWGRILTRLGFLLSLGIAVALAPERLFFLIMIAPVIVLFFLVHGSMGRAFGKQAGPLTAGLALGLILAWALGVSFPMFAETGT